MAIVFIGGSRAVSRLNALIREQLDNLIDHESVLLIGDANGSDKAVQQYLADRGYRNVSVFCMQECRNNRGEWTVRTITSNGRQRDFTYYSTKDRAMAEEAHCGLMLWDGKSKGTLSNIITLLSSSKKVLVYLSRGKKFYKLSTLDDLCILLQRCDPLDIERAARQLGLTPKLKEMQMSMH
jgi:hypothetical protein